jgi:putative spermidine/putrescine transport system permease protein
VADVVRAARRRRGNAGRLAWRLLILVLYLYLLGPILVGLVLSFSAANSFVFPPPGYSLRWYQALFANAEFKQAFVLSLEVASAATVLAVLLGGAAAIAVTRGRFPGRNLLLNLLTFPLIVPAVVTGLGLLLVMAPLGLIGSLPMLLGAHTLVTMPFVAQIVAVGIRAVPPEYEEAARSLGATQFNAFRRILVPQIAPSVLAAAAIAFIVSMGEASITLFIVGRNPTLPVVMYRFVTAKTDPTLAALSVVFLSFTILAVVVVQVTVGGLRRLSPAR